MASQHSPCVSVRAAGLADSLRAGGCGSLSSLLSLGDRIIDSVSQTRPTDGCGDLGRGWESGARA